MKIAGVDEVGRGPLSGPVIAAAVILDKPIKGLKDSKKLSEKKRNHMAVIIERDALCFAYGRVDPKEIDALNIHQATLLAMKRAVSNLSMSPDKVIVDGIHEPTLPYPTYAIAKADDFIDEVSAASIIAKVKRDNEMIAMDSVYPGYGFAKHKGYPTKAHLEALALLGVCPIHRCSFGPVAQALKAMPVS